MKILIILILLAKLSTCSDCNFTKNNQTINRSSITTIDKSIKLFIDKLNRKYFHGVGNFDDNFVHFNEQFKLSFQQKFTTTKNELIVKQKVDNYIRKFNNEIIYLRDSYDNIFINFINKSSIGSELCYNDIIKNNSTYKSRLSSFTKKFISSSFLSKKCIFNIITDNYKFKVSYK